MEDGIDDGQRGDDRRLRVLAEDDRENDRSLEHPRDGYLSGVAVIVGAEVKSILENASTWRAAFVESRPLRVRGQHANRRRRQAPREVDAQSSEHVSPPVNGHPERQRGKGGTAW